MRLEWLSLEYHRPLNDTHTRFSICKNVERRFLCSVWRPDTMEVVLAECGAPVDTGAEWPGMYLPNQRRTKTAITVRPRRRVNADEALTRLAMLSSSDTAPVTTKSI